MPISYCPALNKSSILLCILGLCITLVLYQEQRKLVDTGSAAGVSTLTTPSFPNWVINSYVWQGCIFRYPQYKLWIRSHCNRPQPAPDVVRVGVLPFCNSGFLDDLRRSTSEDTSPNYNFCSGRNDFSMRRCMGGASPTGEAFRGDSIAGICSTFSRK
jgi:hypothetical protein